MDFIDVYHCHSIYYVYVTHAVLFGEPEDRGSTRVRHLTPDIGFTRTLPTQISHVRHLDYDPCCRPPRLR